LVDFMHGAQRVCRLCRQARLPKTSPADERYAQFLVFAGMAPDTNSPANLLKLALNESSHGKKQVSDWISRLIYSASA